MKRSAIILKKFLIAPLVACLSFHASNAQVATLPQNTTDSATTPTLTIHGDDEVLEKIDQALAEAYQKAFLYDIPEDSTAVQFLDSLLDKEIIAERMKELDRRTPFELAHNNYVHAFIRLYAIKKPTVTRKMLGIAPYYYPMFEEELANEGLPLELKYLPIVESALNPKARSRAGAMGLWQFMYRTGKMYGLQVNSYYDERMDPLKSTQAAADFLAALYALYGDWNLVIAAYNCGPGNVNKAIRRSGGKRDYWEIRRWLPRETRGYVPAFIAVNYIMNHAEEHGLTALPPKVDVMLTDTVYAREEVSFDALAKALGLEKEWLLYFNPMYTKEKIPATNASLPIYLPQDKVGLFLTNEDSIYAYEEKIKPAIKSQTASVKSNRQPVNEDRVIHRVRSGEVLGVIAERYHCRVSQIRSWNGLRSSRIYPGQKLTIYTHPQYAKAPTPKPKKPAPTIINGKYRYYVIQPGDTLWDIAKKYKQVTVNDLKRLNSNLNFRKLKPGDRIRVSKVG